MPIDSRRTSHRRAHVRIRRSRRLRSVLAFVLVALAAAPAYATENGLQEYPIGVDTVLPALTPTPGQTQFYNYLEYYSSSSFVNGAGKSALPGFRSDVAADAIRVLHTWNFRSGHFSFSSGIVDTVLNVSLQIAGHGQTTTNFADLVVQPVEVNYVSADHRLWAFSGIGVSLPTGSYHQNALANTGLNIHTLDLFSGVTWFADPRVVASLKLAAELPSLNATTHYQSGSTLNLDYSAEYAPRPRSRFHYGVQGFVAQQFSNDTVDGRVVNGGNISRAFAVGPQLRYDVKNGGFAIKFQHEFGVLNRSTGDLYWFEFALPL